MQYRNVLFPTDLSAGADAAWPHATLLAEKLQATLHAVCVVEKPAELTSQVSWPALKEALRDVRLQAERQLEAKTRERPESIRLKQVVLEAASPSRALLEYVERSKIDLVVMASAGRSGASRLLLGSVTDRMVRLSPVPVLVVRAPGAET